MIAVLLIDMVDFMVSNVESNKLKEMLMAQKEVLKYCSQGDIPVFVVEYGTCEASLDELKVFVSKVKRHSVPFYENKSAFNNSDLVLKLNELGVDSLVLMGVNASSCIKSTVKDAIKTFKVYSAEDLIANDKTQRESFSKVISWFEKNTTFFKSYGELLSSLKK